MIELDFNKMNGLIPVVTVDYKSLEVLMLAFMNKEAWDLTQETQIVHYFSRTRNKLWKKGETSGNIQKVKEIRIDCDNDTLLVMVDQIGDAACHTGYKSCFYRVINGEEAVIDKEKVKG